ncbi:uncharacterized protein LOC112562630 isoform X2 [Pomacea canaliculata]|uniref:uncharacterized protein LOC112562630 isoform X2 n=1 Tax=Pomacea canaliculata TaxID=400727 RepID=UPI000D72EBB0|nr:uncharacterized protein LOC112562630 isoform X2 [Pomacea canaliculata]
MARLLECADANSDPLHVCVCVGALRERLAKMLTAVSDTEKENPPLWGMGVVATAIAVNFFGSLAQKELKVMIIDDYPDSSQTLLTFGLALLQILSAVLVFQSSSISFSGSPTNREAAILATFAHAGWLYLTSYRLWGQDTGASVSYGALEPIFCILLLCIAAGIPTELSKVGAVAAICLGTGMMTATSQF